MLLRAAGIFCGCTICLEAVDFLVDTGSLGFTKEFSTFGVLISENTGILCGDLDA